MRCSRHGAQLMGASGARCRGKACHGVANDAVATTNERRRHGRRALGRQSRAPCCHNANRGAACPNSVPNAHSMQGLIFTYLFANLFAEHEQTRRVWLFVRGALVWSRFS